MHHPLELKLALTEEADMLARTGSTGAPAMAAKIEILRRRSARPTTFAFEAPVRNFSHHRAAALADNAPNG
jgi:hypothetical protein